MRHSRSTAAVFAWPLAIFTAGIAGLVIALTGDGWRDAAAWAALTAPIAAVIWAMARRQA
jgi:energy-converting hydrogenase Eha subunit C